MFPPRPNAPCVTIIIIIFTRFEQKIGTGDGHIA